MKHTLQRLTKHRPLTSIHKCVFKQIFVVTRVFKENETYLTQTDKTDYWHTLHRQTKQTTDLILHVTVVWVFQKMKHISQTAIKHNRLLNSTHTRFLCLFSTKQNITCMGRQQTDPWTHSTSVWILTKHTLHRQVQHGLLTSLHVSSIWVF